MNKKLLFIGRLNSDFFHLDVMALQLKTGCSVL